MPNMALQLAALALAFVALFCLRLGSSVLFANAWSRTTGGPAETPGSWERPWP